MTVIVANSVCSAAIPTFLSICHHECPEKTFPGLGLGIAEKPVSRNVKAILKTSKNSQRHKVRSCALNRNASSTVERGRRLAGSVEARGNDARDLQTSAREENLDDMEPGENSLDRKSVQVARDNGFVDVEAHLGLSKQKKSRICSSPRTKAKSVDLKEVSDGKDRFSEDMRSVQGLKSKEAVGLYCEEVKFRSEGDAANLAQVEVLPGTSALRVFDEKHLLEGSPDNGSPGDWVNPLEDNTGFEAEETFFPSGEKNIKTEGLVRHGEQFSTSLTELRGGRLVADLVTAWEGLSGRLALQMATSKSSQLLLSALKLALSAMRCAEEDGRPILSRSLAIAYTLADLQMDAEVLAAGLLHDVVEAGLLGILEVEGRLGVGVSRILHDCSRFKMLLGQMDIFDDASASALRQFCLAYHDLHAIIVELSVRLNVIRCAGHLPRYQQQIMALETMQIYAPLAHAICSGDLCLELEDLAFKILFPDSYEFLENWLKKQWLDGDDVVEKCKVRLCKALEEDSKFQILIDRFTITGRYKSRFSTMKKLLKDGRKPEEVYDVLGLRIVVHPMAGSDSLEENERGSKACYRVLEIARTLWKEVPGRLKDYIANPKSNGYESLHIVFYVDKHDLWHPSLELQIRTAAMDAIALGGDASHASYKGGLTDLKQVQHLKSLMMASAKRAAISLKELAGDTIVVEGQVKTQNQVFMLFDKNNDGVISMAELGEVMRELGANQEDAEELMQLVDKDTDGSLTADEFAEFQKQARILRGLDGADKQFSSQLGWTVKESDFATDMSRGEVSKDLGMDFVSKDTISHNSSLNKATVAQDESVDSSSFLPVLHKQETLPPCVEFREKKLFFDMDDPDNSLPQKRLVNDMESGNNIVSKTESTKQAGQDLISQFPSRAKEELIRRESVDDEIKSTTNDSRNEECDLTTGSVKTKSSKLLRPAPSRSLSRIVDLSQKDESGSSFQQGIENKKLEGQNGPEVNEVRLQNQQEAYDFLKEGIAKARALLASRNTSAARDLIKILVELHPADPKLLVEYAHVERLCGDLVAAGALLSRAIKAFKAQREFGYDYIRALQAWGSVEAEAQNAHRARFLFTESIHAARREEVISPNSVSRACVYGLHAWARLEEQLGNWRKARDLLAKAAEFQPGNAVVHQSRALLEARAHNYGAARTYFRLAVEAAPNDVKCWQAWALFEARQGKRRKMRQLFQRALQTHPMDTPSLQAWAHQEAMIGTKDSQAKARRLFKQCIDIDSKDLYSWQAWAVMEQTLGNFAEARNLFEQALRINPSCEHCLQAYAHMERVCGNLDTARKILRRAWKLVPESAAVLMEAAFVEEELGNKDVAEELFKQAGMIDKKKSRVKRRMFESRKALLLSNTSGSRAVNSARVSRNSGSSFHARKVSLYRKRREKIHKQHPKVRGSVAS